MKFLYSYLILIVFFLTDCAAYIPNVTNVPLHEKEGECDLAFYGGLTGFDPQLSFAFTNKFALMCNGSFGSNNREGHHSYLEAGLGYYLPFSKRFVFENFVGFGKGESNYQYSFMWSYSMMDAEFKKIFFQPEIGFIKSKRTQFIFCPKFSFINTFGDMHQSGIDSHFNTNFMYFEPSLTLKTGWENFKIVAQLGLSMPMTKRSVNTEYFFPMIFSIGMQYRINSTI